MKILLHKVATCVVVCVSCACNHTTPTKIGDEVIIDISEVEYEGHVYAIFHERNMGEFEVVHSPECPKCVKLEE